MRPRKATVVAERSLTIHSTPGSATIVGSLSNRERVRILDTDGPPKHTLTWHKIESERDSGSLVGWVAEGHGKAVWLQLDAPQEETDHPDPILQPRPRPPLMPDPPSGPIPGWPVFAVLAFIAVIIAVIWGAR